MPAMLPPDRTMGTRASAKLYDARRMQSVHEESPEERLCKERDEYRSTVNMAVAAVATIAIFLFVWWLVVH